MGYWSTYGGGRDRRTFLDSTAAELAQRVNPDVARAFPLNGGQTEVKWSRPQPPVPVVEAAGGVAVDQAVEVTEVAPDPQFETVTV